MKMYRRGRRSHTKTEFREDGGDSGETGRNMCPHKKVNAETSSYARWIVVFWSLSAPNRSAM